MLDVSTQLCCRAARRIKERRDGDVRQTSADKRGFACNLAKHVAFSQTRMYIASSMDARKKQGSIPIKVQVFNDLFCTTRTIPDDLFSP